MKKSNKSKNSIMGKLLMTVALISTLAICHAGTPVSRHPNVNHILPEATEHVMDVPLSMVVYNECCDEEVYLTGIGHIVTNNNVSHVNVTDITGIGLSTGYTYASLGSQCLNNVMYSSPVEGTLNLRVNMRNEDGCSFKIKVSLHINVNANEEVTGSFTNIVTQCH